MEQLTDLKTILHSKRANIYYLEKCRVMQKDGRVLYLTEESTQKQYWNIPIANTTCLLLGTGTSITQAAVRMLASAGVMIGFCGGGGTPLLMGMEVEWLSPQNEYRPTKYLQGWMAFWFDEAKRLQAAKYIQQQRIAYFKHVWAKDRDLHQEGFQVEDPSVEALLQRFMQRTAECTDTTKVLSVEGELTKSLYRLAARHTKQTDFHRDPHGVDDTNKFLTHGNYLAYGLAATTLWVLGIPHGCAVMHGKTRRGALVFDIADLIKDTLILPWAFICGQEGSTEQAFRHQCLQNFIKHKALDFMFDTVKDLALKTDWDSEPKQETPS